MKKLKLDKTMIAISVIAAFSAVAAADYHIKKFVAKNASELLQSAAKSSSPISLPLVTFFGEDNPSFLKNWEYALRESLRNNDFRAFDSLLLKLENRYRKEGVTEEVIKSQLEEKLGSSVRLTTASRAASALKHLATHHPRYFKVALLPAIESSLCNQCSDKVGHAELAKLALQHTTPADQKNFLDMAVSSGILSFANVMADNGVKTDFESIYKHKQYKPYGVDQLSWMKEHGINIHGHNFETTLEAARRDKREILEFLMQNGANRQDVKNRALNEAIGESKLTRAKTKTIEYLLTHGAEVNADTLHTLTKVIPEAETILRLGHRAGIVSKNLQWAP